MRTVTGEPDPPPRARLLRKPRFDAVVIDRAHAARVAVGLLVPGFALIAIDRADLIIYAVFGSFTGMYGRAPGRALRLLHQCQGAVLLLAGAGGGIVLSRSHVGPWTVIAAATVFSVGGSLLADFFALRPEGPFYGVFALGAIAGTSPHSSPGTDWLIAAGAAALAIAIGLSAGDATGRAPQGLRHSYLVERSRSRTSAIVHAARYALAVAAAGSLAYFFGLGHVNWAIAGAAVTLAAADPRGRLRRGVQRIVGTLAGLVVTALILLPGLGPRSLGLIVIALVFPTELLMTVNYALALSFFTPMIMLMTELAQPIGLQDLLVDRGIGTMIGVLSGLAITWLVRDAQSWLDSHAAFLNGIAPDDQS